MGETHDGACHCKAVRFLVTLSGGGLGAARRCDCSFCRMRGAVVVSDRAWEVEAVGGFSPGGTLAELVGFQQFAGGAVAGPQDCFLAARGLKTLSLRMQRHQETAGRIAEWLIGRPEVAQVLYPGLPEHPGHELAARQMDGFGGMVSFRVHGGEAAARRFAESTKMYKLSVSLGGVESLICWPSEMTHGSVAGTPLAVPVDLVRLSVGIEDLDDHLEDLERAFGA